jgi:transposase
MSRTEAAPLAGMERQALRDAVIRFNAEGLDGLRGRLRRGQVPMLTEAEQAVRLEAVFRGPDRADNGGSDWTLAQISQFGW